MTDRNKINIEYTNDGNVKVNVKELERLSPEDRAYNIIEILKNVAMNRKMGEVSVPVFLLCMVLEVILDKIFDEK